MATETRTLADAANEAQTALVAAGAIVDTPTDGNGNAIDPQHADTSAPTDTSAPADTSEAEAPGNPHALAGLLAMAGIAASPIVGAKPAPKGKGRDKPAPQASADKPAKPAEQAPAGKRAERAKRGEQAPAPSVATAPQSKYPGDPGDSGLRMSASEIDARIGAMGDYPQHRIVVFGRSEAGGAIRRTARQFAVIADRLDEGFEYMWLLGYAGLFERVAREAGFVEIVSQRAMLPNGYKLDQSVSTGFAIGIDPDTRAEVVEFVAHGSKGGPKAGGALLSAEQAKALGLLAVRATKGKAKQAA